MALKNVKVVYDRRKKAERCGKGTVEVLVYLNRLQRKYIVYGECTPMEWLKLRESKSLVETTQRYQSIVFIMEMNGLPMTIDQFNVLAGFTSVESEVLKQEPQRGSFLDFMEEAILKDDLAPYTKQQRLVALRSLREFGQIVTFADLTPANIQDYDGWLRMSRNGKRYAGTTIDNYHKRVHKYIHKAYERGIIERDPYDCVKIVHGKNKERKPLLEQELVLLRDAEIKDKCLERVRDLFIFAAYTGLAYVDAAAFDFETMTEQLGGIYYIDGKRTKTGSDFYTPILPPAMDVLKKYNFKLPFISNQKVNMYLHVLEKQLGIKKSISYHVARHTFATVVLSYNVPIDKVARMLGHKNIKTTQIYAKILKTSIQDQGERLAKMMM